MQVVVWLLKHCLLIQLHTYVFLVPGPKGTGVMASESKLTGTKSALTIPRQIVSPSSLEDLPLFKAHSASDVNSGIHIACDIHLQGSQHQGKSGKVRENFSYFLFQCSNGFTVLQRSMAKVHWPNK